MASFVTSADLAAWLGKDVAALNAAQATLVLDVASEAIRSYCGWGITQSVDTVVVAADGWSSVLWLPTLHLTAVGSVTEDGVPLVAGTDFWWSDNGRLVRSGGFWSRRPGGVVVVFTHGYVTAPGVVRGVCLGLAGRALTNTQGYRSHSESQGDWSESWVLAGGSDAQNAGPGLTPQELGDLSPFRLPVVV